MKQTAIHTILFFVGLLPQFSVAQKTDTLPPVKLQANTKVDNAKSPRLIQRITQANLETLNSVSVADATKFFSGVLIKDYGGLGGLKTISVRSLGTGYTSVMYDAVLLSDVQAGQIDLGKISTSNIESITLYNGQPVATLMPAKAFAAGAVLDLQTGGSFDAHSKLGWKGTAMIKAGSFNFFNPSVSIQFGKNNFLQKLSAEWQSAKGNYSYKAYELDGSTKKRTNSDLQSLRVEYDAGFTWKQNNRLQFKAYHYNSNRGLPGAVALYTVGGKERLADKNSFIQSAYKKNISAKSRLMLLAKYAHQYNFYKDPNTRYGPQGLENRFTQQEIYFSAGYSYKFSKILSASYSSDYVFNSLNGEGQFATAFAQPKRQSIYNNILLDAKWNKLHLQANALHTLQRENVVAGPVSKDISRLNPSVSLSIEPFKNDDIHLRFFYKNIFKAPTFNDLYYAYVGNTNLRPEQATQFNVGITWQKDSLPNNVSLEASADFYVSNVKDKIVAVPNQNLFRWTMLNYGMVHAKGVDIALQTALKLTTEASIAAKIMYGYQDAKEADKNSDFYGLQIPYTPLHSGSIQLTGQIKKITIAVNSILSSYRYKLGNQIADNLVKEWATVDLHLSYKLKSGNSNTKIFGELNNMLNSQYEIIKFYPMPRLNYRVGITSNF